MDNSKLNVLMSLKKSFQDQLDQIYVVEKEYNEKIKNLKDKYEHIKKNNIFGEEILKSLELTIKFEESQLENFKLYSKDSEKHYRKLLYMVNQLIEELTK
ncbi:hypothetical protein ACNR9V_03185 [Parageobacillus thermoglucosidasius]|uniref:hypothetical protein n=1 Tax=Parageobacillus thermoglucosidasius TaxID=1426 RepID=UPI003B670891